MAERRMFAKTIIDSDAFLDMPMSTQNLYFHLSMRADDDGFINNPKKIARMIGCASDDLKMLLMKNFVIGFDGGIVVIKHWKIHNYIRADRYQPTVYQDELQNLEIKDNKSYTLKKDVGMSLGIPHDNQWSTQDRLGKDRLGKDTLSGEAEPPFLAIVNHLNEKASKNYKHTSKKTQTLIKARLNEGFKEKDFYTVIDKKTKEWLGTQFENYLRPETLFGTKFEGYLNQKDTGGDEIEFEPLGGPKYRG
jgi:uncharacterized phage protein (TIGR02220 family)